MNEYFFVVVFIKYLLWIFSCILCVYCIRMLYRLCFVQHCAKFGNWSTLSGMSEFEILRTFLSIFFFLYYFYSIRTIYLSSSFMGILKS